MKTIILFLFCTFFCSIIGFGQQDGSLSAHDLKMLSVEDLMNLEVTLVSRSPQKLSGAPSSVQVITAADIRHSGASNVAEALRLVSNLQVSQPYSHAWIIGSRGFNTVFANKLLVMIDGRTVYTPLFAGVLWDMQNLLLEDIERIEVVSGPGGSLWGANAVNGIVNIVTRNSSESQGLYASVQAGTFVKDQAAVRWGGKIGKKINYRIYGQHFDRNTTRLPDGSDYVDAWGLSQGGFRMDWKDGETDAFTVQGDYYGGAIKTVGEKSNFDGQNLLGRWTRTFGENSDLAIQVYYDRYFKSDRPGKSSDRINTGDIDFQHRFPIAKKHILTWGLGYRSVSDKFVSDTPAQALLPESKNLDLATAFVQDEINLSRIFTLSLGTKILHNVYTGIEFQPSVRMAAAVNTKSTLWAAISRAVRTPSRLDVDYYAPAGGAPPTVPSIAGGPEFVSEKLIAYEIGYRLQPGSKSNISIAAFYNNYDDIYSLERLPGLSPTSDTLTLQTQNGSRSESWGIELSAAYQVSDKWNLRGGYTYFDMDIKAKTGHDFDPSYLANDVRNQFFIQSASDLPYKLHLDLIARYMDNLPQTIATNIVVPSYFTFDARLAYTIKFAELSVVGQNLFEKEHSEFTVLRIPRSVYAKLTVRL